VKAKIIITLLIFFSAAVRADELQDIKKTAESIKSVSAAFIQEKHMKILAKPMISKGKFFFTAPGSVRWEYISPVKSILLVHNGAIKSYIEGRDGLVEDTKSKAAMGIVMQEITSWLKGSFDSPAFRASLDRNKIILTPKDKSFTNIISSIIIEYRTKEKIIKSVRINESSDSYTLITFSEVFQNKDIDNKTYTGI
jgi:outer membrane lipoprotein carrier protein